MKIRKAVIVAAGWGTRFLPVTKVVPKEMLPLVNKPLLQLAVEEAINAGIEQIILITASGKRAMEDYFDRNFQLEQILAEKGKDNLLQLVRGVSQGVSICAVRQPVQLGLGHAVLMAKNVVGNEPFAVFLPDDIVDNRIPLLNQLIATYQQHPGTVIAVERVKPEDTEKYGIIEGEQVSDKIYRVADMIEKPKTEDAPSLLGVVGRYILMPEIFKVLEATSVGKGGEIQLTDGIKALCRNKNIFACELEGTRYDTGTPLGWLKANFAYAMKDEKLAAELKTYLRELL